MKSMKVAMIAMIIALMILIAMMIVIWMAVKTRRVSCWMAVKVIAMMKVTGTTKKQTGLGTKMENGAETIDGVD